MSNKVSKEEQKLVRHHFLSILEPTELHTVSDFKRKADKIIEQMHNENKLPIIVGGTYYYVESILYDKLINTESAADELTLRNESSNLIAYRNSDLDNLENFFKNEIKTFGFDDVNAIKLHNLLKQVDEETANKIHPNDKRKIVRALQVYQKTNKKYSDLIKEQHRLSGDNQARISGRLRFANSLILNLDVDKSILHERIDKRVELMEKNGLINELTSFFNSYNEIKKENRFSYLDHRKGIFQVIGFKEFNDYFNYMFKQELNGKRIVDERMTNNEVIKDKLMRRGLSNLKMITKKYSKTQLDWYRNRILSNLNRRQTPPIFNLNANSLDEWNANVLEPSIEIVDHILIKQAFNLPVHLSALKAKEIAKKSNEKQLRHCKYCVISVVDEISWQLHLNSKNHNQNRKLYFQSKLPRINLKLISKISFILLLGALIGFRFGEF